MKNIIMKFLLGYLRLGTAFLFSICMATTASAADVKVIINSGVDISAISSDDLKSIFLLTKKSFSDGTHAEPVLSKGGAVHEAFLKGYLGKTDDSLTSFYRNAVFAGKGLTPRAFASDAEVAAYVAKTKGAIGYVGSDPKTSGVKTVDMK
jgi:ABC-type phosphate transport system substrate-binding protein